MMHYLIEIYIVAQLLLYILTFAVNIIETNFINQNLRQVQLADKRNIITNPINRDNNKFIDDE